MSVNFLFELTNDILVELLLKNKAWFQKETYCIHLYNNRKAIHLDDSDTELYANYAWLYSDCI